MTNLLFATKLPSPTIVGVREEARRQRRNINTIVDAALRQFLSLPEAVRDALDIGEPMQPAARQALGLATGPRPVNRKKGGAL